MAIERGDAELVKQALAGSQEAFGELVARYKDAVFGVAFHRLGDFEEARDAAQETFVKAFRNLRKLRRPEAFANWLYWMAEGTAIDAARRRRGEVSLEDAGESAVLRVPSEDRIAEQVREALGALPEATRLAVILHYVDGYSHAEVAQFLGTTEGAVKTRVSRGRARLREEMAEMVESRLKKESAVFVFEATDDSGRLITGQTDARSAAAVRKRLTEKGYRVTLVKRDRRTTEAREEDDQEPITRVASVILEQAIKDDATSVRIALDRRSTEAKVRVGYLLAGAWHEVMVVPDYIWEPLRRKRGEMAGVGFREGARRAGRIRFEFEGAEREWRATFGKRVVRLVARRAA
ncbi:MAG: sigma-70 family RNA polymerase sigma factor [Armatimonadetes bacterium]|nr:sigma-70 family RNA polymerase sigma factor [Armatimonadota bacterium]